MMSDDSVVISFFSLIKDAFNEQEPPGIMCDENEDQATAQSWQMHWLKNFF